MSRQPRERTEPIAFVRETILLMGKLDAVGTLDALGSLLAEHLARCGVTHFAIARLPPPGESAMGPLVLVDRWPAGWMRHYDERRYARHDPVLARMVARYDPFSWADLPLDRRAEPTAYRLMHEAAEAGLAEGFTVPILDPSGMQGCVTMAGPALDPHPDIRGALHMAALFAYGAAERIHARGTADASPPLTGREREIMRWLATGHAQIEIADSLGISERTVEHHVRNARAKLRARTTTHAVVAAIRRRDIRL